VAGDIVAQISADTVEELPRDVAERQLPPRERAKEGASWAKVGFFHSQRAEFPLKFSWTLISPPKPFISLKFLVTVQIEMAPFLPVWNAKAGKAPRFIQLYCHDR
jgi:hypothetical protein